MSRAQYEAKPYSASRYLTRPRKSPGFWNSLCYTQRITRKRIQAFRVTILASTMSKQETHETFISAQEKRNMQAT